jgi:hypothetical protein
MTISAVIEIEINVTPAELERYLGACLEKLAVPGERTVHVEASKGSLQEAFNVGPIRD